MDAAAKAFERALRMHKAAVITDQLAQLGLGLLMKSLLAAALLKYNQVRLPICIFPVCLPMYSAACCIPACAFSCLAR